MRLPRLDYLSFAGLAFIGLAFGSASALAASAPGGEATVEEYIQKFSSVPSVLDRRDPFIKATQPYAAAQQVPNEFANFPVTALQRHALSEYRVIAVMHGDSYSRALVATPDKKVIIVREKDRISKRFNLVKKITDNGLIVIERSKGPRGKMVEREQSLAIPPPKKE